MSTNRYNFCCNIYYCLKKCNAKEKKFVDYFMLSVIFPFTIHFARACLK